MTGKRIQPGKSKTYHISYTFDTRDGMEVNAEMKVDQPAYDFAKGGDAVTVLYDPARPKRSAIYKCIQYRALDEHGGEIVV